MTNVQRPLHSVKMCLLMRQNHVNFGWQLCRVCVFCRVWGSVTCLHQRLSFKSWGKCLEHVAPHNKGIALRTTRRIGTQLKPRRGGEKSCQCVSVCGRGGDIKKKVWFGPKVQLSRPEWGPNSSANQWTSHTPLIWRAVNTFYETGSLCELVVLALMKGTVNPSV